MLTPRDFANVLREIMFAMRRLEAIDKPPNPSTMHSATHKLTQCTDPKEWNYYASFIAWYWELDSPADKWMTKGSSPFAVIQGG